MAIQSATALNAYLTADSSGAYGAGSSAPATTDGGSPSRAEGGVTPEQIVDAPVEDAPGEEAPGEGAPGEGAPARGVSALPAMYARNARPVVARTQTPSISLLA